MIDTIREVVQNTLMHWGLTDYMVGTVVEVAPLRVKVDDRLFLEKGNLILTSSLGALLMNDRLVILSVLRGQKYILLSKVVET